MWRIALTLSLLWGTHVIGYAQDSPLGEEIEQLKLKLAELKTQLEQAQVLYEQRITNLEQKVVQLQAQVPVAAAAQTGQAVPTAPSEQPSFMGGQRTLQRLNPEISAMGDVTARYSDNRDDPDFNRLNFDGFELAIQHPLDPFSMAKFFLTFEDGEFDLEEGYVSWESLPGNLGFKVGRFHSNFGKLNRYHKHALPWADRDLPTRLFFGDEGLVSEGVSLTWLPPKLPIAQTNELYLDVLNNNNDMAFSGRGYGDPVFVGRLMNYYDVTDNAYFEWGLSAATSHWDLAKQNRSTVYGLDFSYRWEPLGRALYHSLELHSEFFYNDRQNWDGGNPFGMYASGEYQLNRSWYAGLRYASSDSLDNSNDQTWVVSPFITFWQSEFVRIRAQYDLLRRDFDRNENRFYLQFTWALGPHKHEAY